MVLTRGLVWRCLAVAVFTVKILLDLFGGHSPVDLLALGLLCLAASGI